MAQGVYHESTQTFGVNEDKRLITNKDTTRRRGLARGEKTTTSNSTIPHWMGQLFPWLYSKIMVEATTTILRRQQIHNWIQTQRRIMDKGTHCIPVARLSCTMEWLMWPTTWYWRGRRRKIPRRGDNACPRIIRPTGQSKPLRSRHIFDVSRR